MKISAAVFKINTPLPLSTFPHCFIYINFTKSAMDFNRLVIFFQQKSNRWTGGGIFNRFLTWHGEKSRRDTDCLLLRLVAHWTQKCFDTMVLAPSICRARLKKGLLLSEHISYFLLSLCRGRSTSNRTTCPPRSANSHLPFVHYTVPRSFPRRKSLFITGRRERITWFRLEISENRKVYLVKKKNQKLKPPGEYTRGEDAHVCTTTWK